MDAPDEAATQLDHFADPLSIRLGLNDFPFSLQSLIQDVYCSPLAAQPGAAALGREVAGVAPREEPRPEVPVRAARTPPGHLAPLSDRGGRVAGGRYTLPSIRAIHQLQGMMTRQMTLPPW